jgi:hypothetical protein
VSVGAGAAASSVSDEEEHPTTNANAATKARNFGRKYLLLIFIPFKHSEMGPYGAGPALAQILSQVFFSGAPHRGGRVVVQLAET